MAFVNSFLHSVENFSNTAIDTLEHPPALDVPPITQLISQPQKKICNDLCYTLCMQKYKDKKKCGDGIINCYSYYYQPIGGLSGFYTTMSYNSDPQRGPYENFSLEKCKSLASNTWKGVTWVGNTNKSPDGSCYLYENAGESCDISQNWGKTSEEDKKLEREASRDFAIREMKKMKR